MSTVGGAAEDRIFLLAFARWYLACVLLNPISWAPVLVQDNEKKQKREPKETPEELQECEMVFADF